MTLRPKRVLFVCMGNSGRSQIAAALFNLIADPNVAVATSAGIDAAACVQAEVVTIMNEVGVDLSHVEPIELTARLQTEVNFLVTLGCGERCPLIPEGRRADWNLPDPKGQSIERVRELRGQIQRLVVDLVHEKQWAPQG